MAATDTACGELKTYSKAYKLPVFEGDAFEVDYSATYSPYIEIAGPDNSGAFRSATQTFLKTSYVAPTTGNVTIYVASNTTSPVTGSFSLAVKAIQLPACGKARAVKH